MRADGGPMTVRICLLLQLPCVRAPLLLVHAADEPLSFPYIDPIQQFPFPLPFPRQGKPSRGCIHLYRRALEEVVGCAWDLLVSWELMRVRGCRENLRRDTIGSPARGHGSNWRLHTSRVSERHGREGRFRSWVTYKVYFRCSSISMMAAWFPHR